MTGVKDIKIQKVHRCKQNSNPHKTKNTLFISINRIVHNTKYGILHRFALPYHVLSINKRIIDSHNFNIISTGCNSQDQSPNPPKPYSNKNIGLTLRPNCIYFTSSNFDLCYQSVNYLSGPSVIRLLGWELKITFLRYYKMIFKLVHLVYIIY